MTGPPQCGISERERPANQMVRGAFFSLDQLGSTRVDAGSAPAGTPLGRCLREGACGGPCRSARGMIRLRLDRDVGVAPTVVSLMELVSISITLVGVDPVSPAPDVVVGVCIAVVV